MAWIVNEIDPRDGFLNDLLQLVFKEPARALPTDVEICIRPLGSQTQSETQSCNETQEPAEPIPNFLNRFRDAEARIHQLEARSIAQKDENEVLIGRIDGLAKDLRRSEQRAEEINSALVRSNQITDQKLDALNETSDLIEKAFRKMLDRLQRRVKKLEVAQ